jgi:hypothetical protein
MPTASDLYNRPPTPDERMGMTWWNDLTLWEHRRWFSVARSPAEAWAKFKNGESLPFSEH